MALTDKQAKFVDAYCEAIEAGVKRTEATSFAKEQAGYSPTTVLRDIISDDMATEIMSYANRRLVMMLPTGIDKLESIIDDPTQEGAKVTLDAIGQLFDRGGIVKKESKEVTIKAPTGVVFLPAKVALDEPTE